MALSEQDLQRINDNLMQLDQAQKEVDLAKRAGLHELPNGEAITNAETQITQLRAQLQRVKNTYFPNSP